MSKWIARVSYEIEFDAKDANEAGEVGRVLRDSETLYGWHISERTHVWLCESVGAADAALVQKERND